MCIATLTDSETWVGDTQDKVISDKGYVLRYVINENFGLEEQS
jgi:hypothetical protein